MTEFIKRQDQVNDWRDDGQTVRPQSSSRTVRVKGHDVTVTYRKRPTGRVNPRPGGSPGRS